MQLQRDTQALRGPFTLGFRVETILEVGFEVGVGWGGLPLTGGDSSARGKCKGEMHRAQTARTGSKRPAPRAQRGTGEN